MGVRFLVVSCVSSLLQMWTQRFGCSLLSAAERAALEDQIVLMDPETTFLVKKAICRRVRLLLLLVAQDREAEQGGLCTVQQLMKRLPRVVCGSWCGC